MDQSDRKMIVLKTEAKLAQIEDNTSLIDLLSNEIQDRELEKFFIRNPKFFKLALSSFYCLDEAIIDRLGGVFHFDRLCQNNRFKLTLTLLDRLSDLGYLGKLSYDIGSNDELEWTDEWIYRYSSKWDFDSLSWSWALPWSEKIIDDFCNLWNFDSLSTNIHIPWSEPLISKYEDRLSFRLLSMNTGVPWTVDLIDRYSEKWGWDILSGNESLPWPLPCDISDSSNQLQSQNLLDKFKNKWDWKALSCNPRLAWLVNRRPDYPWDKNSLLGNESYPWNESTVHEKVKGLDPIGWYFFSRNKSIPWSQDILERYADFLEWDTLSDNISLPWNAALLDKYIDKWCWGPNKDCPFINGLSNNPSVPWDVELIERHKHRIDWNELSRNKGIRWSFRLYDKYSDKLNLGHVVRNFDAGITSLPLTSIEKIIRLIND